MEPTTGIEPVNLFLTKEVLYLLSYVGQKLQTRFMRVLHMTWHGSTGECLSGTDILDFSHTQACSPSDNDPVMRRHHLLHGFPIRWWRGEDSNLRRLRRQIYSLLPLAAREPLHNFFHRSDGCTVFPNRAESRHIAWHTDDCKHFVRFFPSVVWACRSTIFSGDRGDDPLSARN